MLEKLEFEIGGFFSGYKKMKIWVDDGKMFKTYSGDISEIDCKYTEEIASEEQRLFEYKLEKLRINGWKKEYIDPMY